jgi:hypothetical protein
MKYAKGKKHKPGGYRIYDAALRSFDFSLVALRGMQNGGAIPPFCAFWLYQRPEPIYPDISGSGK